MKVKIGDVIYDSNEQPIALGLSDKDKQLITDMPVEGRRYCSFPENSEIPEIIKFVNDERLLENL